jgi:MoaA/NifB/PqqE/SkfB family radical SAM enzyme
MVVPTLRCNVGCVYCSADVRRAYPRSDREISVNRWVEILSQTEGTIVFTGGEPFLYEGLMQVIAGIAPRKIRINSNLLLITKQDAVVLAQQPKLVLRLTLHFNQPGWKLKPEAVVGKLQMLQQYGIRFHTIVMGEPNAAVIKRIRDAGIEPVEQLDARQTDPFPTVTGDIRVVNCTRNVRLLGPDGLRYPCWNYMHQGLSPMSLDAPTPFVVRCDAYGCCAYCDRKCNIEAIYD